MSLVGIKANNLRFVPYGFEFYSPDSIGEYYKACQVCGVYSDGDIIYADGVGYINPEDIVKVDTEAYTKAVIETVKEMVDGNIWWIEKKYGSIAVQYGHKSEVMECNGVSYVKADPQPWLDEYKIDLC